MKRLLILITTSILVMLLLSACAYKKYAKEASKYEVAGLYELSVKKYISSLVKKPEYIDSRIGLLRVSTRYAEQLSEKIEQSYAVLDDDAVVSYYLKLKDLRSSVEKFRIDLPIDSRVEGQFKEAKSRFLYDKYRQAETLLDQEKFDDAAILFDQVLLVDCTYENVVQLAKYSKSEPIYRQAVANMQRGYYRSAYAQFSRVLNIDSQFKDASDLRQESLNKGMLTVAFLDVRNAYGHRQFVNSLVAETKAVVQRQNDPFLRMVDLDQTAALIEEQKRALANNLDLKSAIIPVRALLACRIDDITMRKGKFSEVKTKGFLREVKADKTIVYHKIYYYECQQKADAWAQISYDLTSTSSGLILLSGTFSNSTTDNIHYIYYRNDSRDYSIRTGTWQEQNKPFDPAVDYVSDSQIAASSISTLVKARRSLRNIEDLEVDMAPALGRAIAQKLIRFDPE